MAWTQVLAANALAAGAREVVKVGDRKILLLNHENQLYAYRLRRDSLWALNR